MEKKQRSTTTVKLFENSYNDFKIMTVRTKLNLQDLVERSVYLYLTDSEYRFLIHKTVDMNYTGSELLNSIGK
jgi:hypothetical protein